MFGIMKNIQLIFCLLLTTFPCFSQKVSKLEKRLDSLRLLKEEYQRNIDLIQKEYTEIEKTIFQLKFEQTLGDIFYSISGTNILKSPDTYEVIIHLPSNRKVKMLDSNQKYYKINFKDSIGWVLKAALISEKEQFERIQAKKAKEYSDSLEFANYKNSLIKKYGATSTAKILQGRIWLGMTDEMARESIGRPDKINRSVGSWGVHEQWVYDNRDEYLYFEDSILTSWQD